MASVLTAQEISYYVKMAKAIGLTVIAVASSKVQLLDLLNNVPELEIISVNSRNMRLWKLDPGAFWIRTSFLLVLVCVCLPPHSVHVP